MAAEARADGVIRWTTIAMAILATITLDQAVVEPERSRWWILAMTLTVFGAPLVLASWFLSRWAFRRSVCLEARGTLIGLALLFLLPYLVGLVSHRRIMPEIALLSGLRNAGLGLAAMSHHAASARLAVLVSFFVTAVSSSLGGDAGVAVLAPVLAFAVLGAFWLTWVYWNSLELRAERGVRGLHFPVTGLIWVLMFVLTLGGIAVIGPGRAATALAGLVPTSGGTEESDPDARSGVGDGENEVAGSEDPQSVGFTDSEIYLETDRSSLYDAFSDTYGEPFRRQRQEKMVALMGGAIEQKERPAENLRAGREFSAVRKKPESNPRRPGELGAKALVYVKGPTPLHLPLTTYDSFDGTSWSEEVYTAREFLADVGPRDSWISLRTSTASWQAGSVTHKIKVGLLDSSPMPLPPHLYRFRVGSVQRLDFFAWAQYGIVRMTDRTVPAGTVIDSQAWTVNHETLRQMRFLRRPPDANDRYITLSQDYRIDPGVFDLVQEWIRDVPEGWPQVEAVVSRLRQEYELDRSATVSADCEDVVAEFLLKTRRGPDYLFATSAAVLLRSLGYPSRVVSGLYASPENYDPRTRHTPIGLDGIHFWASVRVPGGGWIDIEPTPGYELLPPVLSWRERVAAALAWLAQRGRDHFFSLMAALSLGAFAVWRRGEIDDRLATLAFQLRPARDPRASVLRTLQLVERRARWAGCGRPPCQTPARWYLPLARTVAGEAGATLESLVALADWATHGPDRLGLLPGFGPSNVTLTCQSAVRDWTLSRFRCATSAMERKVATS